MEAKKQGSGEEDLSMEEILQSIRRIIADDSEEGKAASAPAVVNGGAENGVVAASDILELTDMIEDDGSITNLNEKSKEAEKNVDVLKNIDTALAPAVSAQEIKAEVKEEAPKSPPVEKAPAIAPVAVAAKSENKPEADALLSDNAEKSTLSSLSKLNIPEAPPVVRNTSPSPEFRSGNTVEDMVEDMIRPMLKEWLDANLPIIVEKIVEREVTRLSRRQL